MTNSEKMMYEALQSRMAELGYYRLRIDGLWGPGTENAVTRFKDANGLLARPFVGPRTLEAMGPKAVAWTPPKAAEGEPPWLTEARGLLGTREVAGSGDNPVIMEWAKDLDQWYPGDDTAWCGLFTAHCLKVGAPDEPQDFNRLGAREWLKYGEDALDGALVQSADLPLGGVPVFWRTSRSHWHGHVGAAITAQNKTHVRVIGGNQSDNVTEAWFSRDRLLGVRKPTGAALRIAPSLPTGTISNRES